MTTVKRSRALVLSAAEMRELVEKSGPDSPLRQLAGSRARPREIEHQEQAALIRWRDEAVANLPEYAALRMLVAVPNGGKRGKLTAIKLKREGVSAGYPDLVLDVARGGYHGWRGELKVKGGSVSAVQRAWHDRLREQGYCVDVAFRWEAMRDALLAYLALVPR